MAVYKSSYRLEESVVQLFVVVSYPSFIWTLFSLCLVADEDQAERKCRFVNILVVDQIGLWIKSNSVTIRFRWSNHTV